MSAEEAEFREGPVDTALKAINRLTGMDIALDDYALHSITEGEDALGEAVVKMRIYNMYRQRAAGISTDMIEASIRACVDGLNKLVEVR